MICWGIGIVRIDKFKSSCVKLDKYDGNFLWIDFKFYFDVCVELNEWIIVEKGMYLVVVLRGQVQGVFGNLLREDKCNYRYMFFFVVVYLFNLVYILKWDLKLIYEEFLLYLFGLI